MLNRIQVGLEHVIPIYNDEEKKKTTDRLDGTTFIS